MGWEMWVLMLIGMAGFWAVVLLGIRALFLAGGNTPAQGFRDVPENDATAGRSQPRASAEPPARTDSSSTSRIAPIERHP